MKKNIFCVALCLMTACWPSNQKQVAELPRYSCDDSTDASPFVLHQDYCVSMRQELPPLGLDLLAWNMLPDDSFALFELDDDGDSDSSWLGSIRRYMPAPGETLAQGRELASFEVDTYGFSVWPSFFMDVSDSGMMVVGYTRDDLSGEVYIGDWETGFVARDEAPGHYGAAFLADDTLVLNGYALGTSSLGLTGLYAGQISGTQMGSVSLFLADIGMFPGFVGASSKVMVLSGYTATNDFLAFGVDWAVQRWDEGPLDAGSFGAAVHSSDAAGIHVLDTALAVAQMDFTSWSFESVALVELVLQGDEISRGNTTILFEAQAAASVLDLGGNNDLLLVRIVHHATGSQELLGIIPRPQL